MNNIGKTSGVMWLIGVTLLLSVMLIGYMAVGGIKQETLKPSEVTTIASCPESTGVLTVNAYSTLQPSSAVSTPTLTAGINDGVVSTSVTSGTTTFAVGDKVTVLVSKADYIDKAFTFTMPCGGKVLEAPVYYATSDNPSVRIKNSDGDYMSDNVAGGATNQTVVSAGTTFSLDAEFQGTSLESSGDLVYIIEFPAGSAVNISKVELSGATIAEVPQFYSASYAGSKVVAFNIPAVVGSDKATHTITVTLNSAKILAGGVLTDLYSKQDFIDVDGSIKYGIVDSQGTSKYENTGDFDFLINAS